MAVLNIEQARSQFRITRAAQAPNLNLNAGGTRQRPALTGSGVGEVDYVNLGISAWELDFFGRIQSLKDAALAQFLATEESRKSVQISLVAAVASGWLALIADEESLEITRQTLATREEGFKLSQLRFDNGVISEIDLRLAESLLEGARATYAAQQRLRLQDENALALLLGAPVPADAVKGGVGALDAVAPMADVPAGLPSELLNQRPDIRAAEQQLLAANANIGAARANFFPRITLTATTGTVSNELSGLFESGSKAWSFAPALVLPIFDAGANRARLDSAWAGRDIAVAQYEKSIQTAFREVADALAGRAHPERPAARPAPAGSGRGNTLQALDAALSQRRGQCAGRAGCAALAVHRAAGSDADAADAAAEPGRALQGAGRGLGQSLRPLALLRRIKRPGAHRVAHLDHERIGGRRCRAGVDKNQCAVAPAGAICSLAHETQRGTPCSRASCWPPMVPPLPRARRSSHWVWRALAAPG